MRRASIPDISRSYSPNSHVIGAGGTHDSHLPSVSGPLGVRCPDWHSCMNIVRGLFKQPSSSTSSKTSLEIQDQLSLLDVGDRLYAMAGRLGMYGNTSGNRENYLLSPRKLLDVIDYICPCRVWDYGDNWLTQTSHLCTEVMKSCGLEECFVGCLEKHENPHKKC